MKSSVTPVTALLGALALAACTSADLDSAGDTASRREDTPIDSATSSGGQAADAPSVLTDIAFVEDPGGPRILLAGADPGDRIRTVLLDLLDEAGLPATIGSAGGVGEPNRLELPLSSNDRDGASFFLEVQSSPGFERYVRSIVATPRDRRGAHGEPRAAVLAHLPIRPSGHACDPRGFDVCADTLACVVRDGSARCEDRDAARAERCASAPTVDVPGTIAGIVAGTSLWDPVDGCASASRRDRPEAVVRIHLPSNAASITIATTQGGTKFDSVVSVLDGCGAAANVLACNDDDPAPLSRVTLTNVAPGDYFIVVDALDRRGGAFELEVTTP